MSKRYTLSLSPDYVSSWGLWEAVRELLQNALDQKKANSESNVIFNYDPETQVLLVGSTRCKLDPSTLLLGGGAKRYQPELIGQHGEGYKLALLVLTRLSYDVVVLNDDKIWTPRFEHSDEYGTKVLTVTETDASEPSYGVCYRIRDVSREDFAVIAENYLPGFCGNHILDEGHLRKRVFVSGLFVCTIGRLEFGYNFDPTRIKLNRDRNLAPTFEVAYAASEIWSKTSNRKGLYDNMKRGILDTEYVANVPEPTSRWITNQLSRRTRGCNSGQFAGGDR